MRDEVRKAGVRSQNPVARIREKLTAVLRLFILAPDFWILDSVLLHPSSLRPHPSSLLRPPSPF
jgi:hypothetical protein